MRALKSNEIKVRVTHHSMQFSDTSEQQRKDAKRIFRRAVGRGTWWITGTEAGRGKGNELEAILREEAGNYGYRFFSPAGSDCWIAVDKSRITGPWSTYWKLVIPGRAGKFNGKGITAFTFNNHAIGEVTVVAGHYVTQKADPSNAINRKLANAIADYMIKQSKGNSKSLYGGDQNIKDKVRDTFFGRKIITCWDDLKKWPKTAPWGNIDVIARTKRDKGVRCLGARVLTDEKFFLYTDHFTVDAEYAIKVIRSKKARKHTFSQDLVD